MNELNSDEEFKKEIERIWKIRDFIQELEDFKDSIIGILNRVDTFDEGTRKFWISDVKEFYYSTVTAWEMLHFTVRGIKNHLEDARGYFYMAKSKLSQSISELKLLENTEVDKLIDEVKKSFLKCEEAFDYNFALLESQTETKDSYPTIVKVSDKEYQLPCSSCGKIAVSFRIGKGRFDKVDKLVIRGITYETSLNKKLAGELFKLVENADLNGIHGFMKKYHAYEGLDAYCPECDKVYCWIHYNPVEEWDEGFYDCTYGTCPIGHKRIIDD